MLLECFGNTAAYTEHMLQECLVYNAVYSAAYTEHMLQEYLVYTTLYSTAYIAAYTKHMLQKYLVYTLLIRYILNILNRQSILYFPYMLSICIAHTCTDRPLNIGILWLYMYMLGICVAYLMYMVAKDKLWLLMRVLYG